MIELSLLQRIAVWTLPVLFAITLHEVAHGWVANRLGDPTARMLGRLTVNPIKHIDPVGTILVPGILLALGGFVFGWAKPVPVTSQNFSEPRQHMAIVALAGPVANGLMALAWTIILAIGLQLPETMAWLGEPLALMGVAGITINLVLGVLNLLPIPPLDGGRVLSGVVSGPTSAWLDRVEPYGFLIVVGLLVTGVLGYILGPIVFTLRGLLMGMTGL